MELRGSGVEISVVMPAIVRTELAAGLTDARFIKTVEASDVAEAIVKTLQRPSSTSSCRGRSTPRSASPACSPARPPNGSSRTLKGDQVLLRRVAGGTPEYEARAAASAPATDREIAG